MLKILFGKGYPNTIGKEIVSKCYKGKVVVNEISSFDYLACEGYAEIIRKKFLNDVKVVISNE